jgi:hypothetical protein
MSQSEGVSSLSHSQRPTKTIHQIFSLSCQLGADDQQVFLASDLVHWGVSISPAVVVLRHVCYSFPSHPVSARGCREAPRQLRRRPIFISTHCLEPNPAMVNRRQVFLTRPRASQRAPPKCSFLSKITTCAHSLANRAQQLGAGQRSRKNGCCGNKSTFYCATVQTIYNTLFVPFALVATQTHSSRRRIRSIVPGVF